MKLYKENGVWVWRTKPCELTTSTNVSAKQAYEWIKTGHWNLQEFYRWLSEHNA